MKNLLHLRAVFMFLVPAFGQQQADLTFDASVKNPAYTTTPLEGLIRRGSLNSTPLQRLEASL
jgi:hypothetical protein